MNRLAALLAATVVACTVNATVPSLVPVSANWQRFYGPYDAAPHVAADGRVTA